MWKLILLCAVAFFNIKNGDGRTVHFNTKLRISNGVEVVPHSVPYVAQLLITKPDPSSPGKTKRFSCGSTLISVNYVLTAAHCVTDALRIEVVLGGHAYNDYQGTQRILGAGYATAGDDRQYDVATIQLSQEASLTPGKVELVRLSSRADAKSYVGYSGTAYGWGRTDAAGTLPAALLKVDLNIWDLDRCRNANSDYRLFDTDICTMTPNNKGVCPGDSGGPLMINGIQIGVTSGLAGEEKACGTYVGNAFMNVTLFFRFIESNSDVKIR